MIIYVKSTPENPKYYGFFCEDCKQEVRVTVEGFRHDCKVKPKMEIKNVEHEPE